MTAATTAQRQAALKARRKAAGLVQVTVWVHPDWAGVIRAMEKNCKNPQKPLTAEEREFLGLQIEPFSS